MSEVSEKLLIAEYDQAANAYFKGVDIGFKFVQILVLTNAIVITGTAAIVSRNGNDSGVLLRILSIVGIFPSLVLLSILGNYEKQLENCLKRCSEIEGQFGCRFFTDLRVISNDKNRPMTTTGAMKLMAFVAICGWVVVLINPSVFQSIASYINK